MIDTKFASSGEVISEARQKVGDREVIVLTGGYSEERKASIYTAERVCEALLRSGFRARKIDPSENICLFELKAGECIVFNCLHGKFGESGHVSAILDYLQIPYVFSGVAAQAASMDKLLLKAAASKLGVNVLADSRDSNGAEKTRDMPCMIKPRRGGSSMRMHIGKSGDAPNSDYFEEVFAEGEHLTVAVMQVDGVLKPMSVVGVRTKDGSFFDYEAKYGMKEIEKFVYNGPHVQKLQDESVRLAEFLGVSGGARFDFIVSEANTFLLEMNGVPGIYEKGFFTYSAEASGYSYEEMLCQLICSASYDSLKPSTS